MSNLSVFINGIAQTAWFEPSVSSLAGALFGAWGAQIAINRGQRRQAVTSELNSVNSALGLSFSMTNTFMGLKRQHVRPQADAFAKLEQSFEKFEKARQAGPGPHVFEFIADWKTLGPPKVPIGTFEQLLFDKLSLKGRGMQAAVQLIAAVDGLENSMRERNDLIAEMCAEGQDKETVLYRYLGLPANGVTDARNKEYVVAITAQTDDCIFFSKLFFDDLVAYGRRLRRWGKWWSWFLWLPKVQGNVNWSKAKDDGLLPPDEAYKLWLVGFPPKATLGQRITARISGGKQIKKVAAR